MKQIIVVLTATTALLLAACGQQEEPRSRLRQCPRPKAPHRKPRLPHRRHPPTQQARRPTA
jgi:hypothetical protein